MTRKKKEIIEAAQRSYKAENAVNSVYTSGEENAERSRHEGNKAAPLEWDEITVGCSVWLKRYGYTEGWFTVSAKGVLTVSLKCFGLTIGLNKANLGTTWNVYRIEVE